MGAITVHHHLHHHVTTVRKGILYHMVKDTTTHRLLIQEKTVIINLYPIQMATGRVIPTAIMVFQENLGNTANVSLKERMEAIFRPHIIQVITTVRTIDWHNLIGI